MATLKISIAKIIEKNPADAARFATVLEVKIFIAFFFETRIKIFTVGVARCASRAMPVNRILVEAVLTALQRRDSIKRRSLPSGLPFSLCLVFNWIQAAFQAGSRASSMAWQATAAFSERMLAGVSVRQRSVA